MRFKADEIVSVLSEEIKQYQSQIDVLEVGRVLEIGDGIARVYGLSEAMAGELVEFTRTRVRGVAFNLEENSVGVIILGDYLEIEEGDEVRTTGELLRVPVGDALIGRVVDPLGNPMDGKGPIVTELTRPVEFVAPGVAGRQPRQLGDLEEVKLGRFHRAMLAGSHRGAATPGPGEIAAPARRRVFGRSELQNGRAPRASQRGLVSPPTSA